MRVSIIVISALLIAVQSLAQDWSEKAHYDAYMKGDWKEVVRLGKEAQEAGADYYYIRARNGYANFMLGRYFKAEKEFEKALQFNSSDAFSKRYGYWSSVFAGNQGTALIKASRLSQSERDTIRVIRPKIFNSVSVVGGYRFSSTSSFSVDLPVGQNGVQAIASVDPPSSMPYASLYLNHQFGSRVSLNHAVNYLDLTRPAVPTPLGTETVDISQVSYLASISVQVAKKTTVTPSFVMQYWEAGENKVYDLSTTISVRQQFGNIHATVIGGYFQDTDTNKYMVGGTLTYYPLQNQRFYSITSGGFNFGGDAPNPFVRQTIGGNPVEKLWIKTSFMWNNRVVAFEDVGLDFVNNSSDRLLWLWSFSPTYYPIQDLGITFTYSIESRQFYLPGVENPLPIGDELIGEYSGSYDYHSFYLGLHYNF